MTSAGPPPVAYCQLHDRPTHALEAVLEPDTPIIQEESLLYEVEVLATRVPTASSCSIRRPPAGS